MNDGLSKLLIPLIDHLATHTISTDDWEGWRITRVTGGYNNILYRVTSNNGDFAVKCTRRDERDRAGREYAVLEALQQLGLTIAPVPVWLDREHYPQPVLVQTWLEGEVQVAPPATDDEWRRLLEHFATVHIITPSDVEQPLPNAIIRPTSAQAKQQILETDLARIPPEGQPPALRELVEAVRKAVFPTWPEPSLTLCRSDPNTLNLIRRSGAWASVDWENSGWSDPAFEIADLLAHPAYLTVTPERCTWVIDAYCRLRGDTAMVSCIHACYTLMLVDWAIFFARKLHETSAGDPQRQRLVDRPPEWYASLRPNYERYVELGHAALMCYE